MVRKMTRVMNMSKMETFMKTNNDNLCKSVDTSTSPQHKPVAVAEKNKTDQ